MGDGVVAMGHMSKAGAGGAVMALGIVAGTRLAGRIGWRPVESLRRGDRLMTFGNGPQPLTSVSKTVLAPTDYPVSLWPLSVPQGALGNREELLLLPDQKLLVETDAAESLRDEPLAMIGAASLEGWRGIRRCRPVGPITVIGLRFASPQIVYASQALLMSCPGNPTKATDGLMPGQATPQPLSPPQARHLVACLMAQDLGAALRELSAGDARR